MIEDLSGPNRGRLEKKPLPVELLVIFLLVAIIPSLVCIGVHRSAWKKILVREILNRNYQVAETIAFELHASLKNTRKILETTARYPDVRRMGITVLSSVLSTLYQTHSTIFTALYVVDRHGNQLLNVTNAPEAFSDASSAVWYRNVVQGTYSNYTSNPYVSRATGNPSITMAALVRGDMYKVEAVLAAEVDLTHLWSMLKSITIGESGFVYVVDHRGRVICHPREDKVDTEDESFKLIVDKMNISEGPTGPFLIDSGTTEQLVACVPLSKFDELRAPSWVVMVVQPLEEIYTEERPKELRWTDGILIAASILMGLGAAGLFLRRLT